MDAYLSREALGRLKACLLLAGDSGAAGFLLGHKRGHRIFVESVFPTGKNYYSTAAELREADAALGGKIVGFFSSGKNSGKERHILQPFNLGRLYLKILAFSPKQVEMFPLVIDYDGAYTLIPVKLQLPQGRKGRKGAA